MFIVWFVDFCHSNYRDDIIVLDLLTQAVVCDVTHDYFPGFF